MNLRPARAISRRRFLATVAAGVAAARVSAGVSAGAGRSPNVIYAFSDEHRWQAMSFTETPQVRTPQMARLAEQGAQFTHCISNYPVCSPHRAVLMTGRWPFQQGVVDNNIRLDAGENTLGKAFQVGGYRTAYIGKWHLGGNRAESFGFDVSLLWTNTNAHWDKSSYHPAEGPPVTPKGYNATLMTDQALAFIRENKDRPFFLMLSWNPPHSDFTDAPEAKKAFYPQGSLPRRPNWVAPAAQSGFSNRNDWPYYEGYHAHVSAIDDELGRLLEALEELGLTDQTIVVYSSDHGSMLGSHGVGSKRQPYEESVRVPFLIRWPGVIAPGTALDALFGTIDVMPTLCGLAGLRVPEACAGRDFSPLLRGGSGPDPEAQLIMHIDKKNASGGENHPAPLFRGLRTRRHTYALSPGRPGWLFDNLSDPYQMNNLIEDPGTFAVQRALHAALADLLRRANDPFELPPPPAAS